ncbi:MAG: sugar phosphate isomerase/epimerase family protein, partial [Oscillospiraceae bacterium]
MKICYNEATMMKASTLEKDLELCEKAGFDYIEIRIDLLHEYLNEHTMEDLRHFFSSSRIKPHAINAVYIKKDFSLSDDRQRDAFSDEVEKICAVAVALGAPSFIVVPPLNHDRITPWSSPCEKVTESLVGTMKFVGKIAAKYGVGICFELVGAPYSSVRSIAHAK